MSRLQASVYREETRTGAGDSVYACLAPEVN
jgi:hypothetical protein